MSVVGSEMRCEKPPQRISNLLFGGVGTVGMTDVPFWGQAGQVRVNALVNCVS
jgi:hypothetical protein